ncbi:TonB-dependent receptor [Novosphingobium sp. KCTC 2891]|uniref:TonB-dependent receptor n=1 Tax=Novosphingobium sp. KCTC 2891 TaxID=2989730 RepID=UPI0022236D2A|nr:TonB-dependent receptor [Novosphingobium sp. KCTC 2891]MCW1381533.1 TonB-dependent receptor [Novosphingobium sp. KCTC 2891]
MKLVATGRHPKARALLLAGAATLFAGMPGLAAAQEAALAEETAQPATDDARPAAGVDGSDDAIIVTATKREQTLQDVPVAVSVTTAQTIERAQIRDIKDLSSLVPSLRVNQLQSTANTNFFIRGFGNGANNVGIEPSVGVFIDGVYRSRSAAQVGDFPDIERIEVLRGPQSTLFGKNASAGVISIVTAKPSFTFGGNAEASYGNYNAVVLKGVVTGPVSDKVAVSLAGGYNRRDGYNKDLGTGSDVNDRNRWFVRGQLYAEPSTQLRLRLIADYSSIDENCCASVNVRPSASTLAVRALGGNVNDVSERFANRVWSSYDAQNDIRNYGLSGQVDYDLGPLTFTSITAFRRTDAFTNSDADFTSADLIGRFSQDLKINTFTQELRVATNMEGPLNFLVGGYYFNEKIDQASQLQWGADARGYADVLIRGLSGGAQSLAGIETLFGGLSGQDFAGKFFARGQGLDEKYRLKNDAFSVFGQADFKLGDRITITGGVNYTKDRKRFSTNITSSDVFASLDIPALRSAAANYGIAQYIGQTFFNVPVASAAQVQGFAQANPAGFAQINTAAQTRTAPLLGLQQLQYLPAFLNLPNAVEPGRTSDDKVTWVARVAFDVNDQINLYASYATGFKASSINLSRDSRPFESDRTAIEAAGIGVPNQTYGSRYAGPEYAKVYEIGLKADWKVATANIAVFQQSIAGFQSNVFTGKGFILANAGKETVKGIEFEGTVKPAKGWLFSAAFTYLDAKYDKFVLSAVGDLSGTLPAGIPSLSTTLGAQYDWALANGDHLILRGDYHYESPTQIIEGLPGFLDMGVAAAVDAARPFRREVSEVNASITYALANGLELTAWGRNLTNDRYLLNVFDSPAQPHSVTGYTNQPRTYGGTVRYRF